MGIEKVAFTTLGCKVNQYESEAMKSLFLEADYEVTEFDKYADVYVINTCTVTHLGNRKSRQMIRRAINNNPQAVVAVVGCYAQTAPGEVLEIPGVSLVIGTKDRNKIVELVHQAKASGEQINAVGNIMEAEEFEELTVVDKEQRTRAFLKIQEGCNNFCSYCIIPYARGPLRSRQPEKVLEEAENLVKSGFKELVITGICTGTYGKDLGNITLAGLVAQIGKIPGLERLRLGSLEPTDITPELVEVIRETPTICNHLHIPLQSGSDRILAAMNRNYLTNEYYKLIAYLRYSIPDLAVTTDVIVGFPGEKEEDFLIGKNFISRMEFANLHVFKYSPRAGTKAAEMSDQVDNAVKELRSKELIELAQRLQQEFAESYLEEEVQVLAEVQSKEYPEFWEGLTSNYLRVLFKGEGIVQGNIYSIKLEDWVEGKLYGELI